MISTNSSPSEIFEKCLNSAYTRLPIYEDTPENVIGVLHAKDVLRSFKQFGLGQSTNKFNAKIGKVISADYIVFPYMFIPSAGHCKRLGTIWE